MRTFVKIHVTRDDHNKIVDENLYQGCNFQFLTHGLVGSAQDGEHVGKGHVDVRRKVPDNKQK
jgi:hypothetical protein